MSFKVELAESFKKHAKRLLRKFPSLKTEITNLIFSLETNTAQGTDLGNNCYKIRLAIKSKQKGKSGGARIISYVTIVNETVILLTIYDKSEREDISDEELQQLIKRIL
jgi:mRNA-degrading endonuclease RelE of RelBE toxin-antitoxin system